MTVMNCYASMLFIFHKKCFQVIVKFYVTFIPFISILWIVQLSKLYYSFIFVHSGNVGTTMIPRVVSVESVPRPEILSSVKS